MTVFIHGGYLSPAALGVKNMFGAEVAQGCLSFSDTTKGTLISIYDFAT